MAPIGYLALVLHAHLPFVRHPEYEDFLEEDWLYEAITETYLPLLTMMEGLERDGVNFRLTMSFTPTLCSMLRDELLQRRYREHLVRLMELADKEIERTATTPEFHRTALMYQQRFRDCWDAYENRYHHDILAAFRHFQETGNLEIVTCGATHGFLPLMQDKPEAVNAQIAVGAAHYRECFGRPPRGIWNAECGFYPGLDGILARHGLEYFFSDSHAVLFADKRPKYGVFAPILTPGGPACFGRDQESSRAVWSAEHGYPGDFRYREFYRDIGYDLDLDYIKPYIHETGLRISTGIKYYKITGKGSLREKAPYDPADAIEAAATHAGHFLFCRQQQALHLSGLMDRPPLIVSPYDAELFGHWWFEGPRFLEFLFRKIHYDQTDIALVTPHEYLQRFPENQVAMPSMSSWGSGGFGAVWLDGSNDWIYHHLDEAVTRMIQLARENPAADGLRLRALNQCARELLLAQASDWAFIMKTNTVVGYAIKRTQDHLSRFMRIDHMLHNGGIDEKVLADFEFRDNPFSNIDYRVYQPLQTSHP
ncbi:DUF1957 domain-containing protein [Candidatus Poribacteria bacterium]|nr:DUF1957 domain-containing protein [Candidatus Poribacteria bacterium]